MDHPPTPSFHYCPRCGKAGIAFREEKQYHCSDCGFTYFHNVATAAGVILHSPASIIVIRRNREPGKGLWALPGGFVDPGESAEEAVLRECYEEIGLRLRKDELRFVTTGANRYKFGEIVYNTCDLFFSAAISDGREIPFTPNSEVAAIERLDRNRIDTSRFAFPSVQRAMEIWLHIQG